MKPSRPLWSPQVKIAVSLVILAGFIFLLYKFSAVIAPVVLAVILAYVLTPLVNRLQTRLKGSRGAAIAVIYLLLALFISGALWIIIPLLIQQVRELARDITLLLHQAQGWADQPLQIGPFTFSGEALLAQLSATLQDLLRPLFTQTIDIVAALLESIVWVVFIVVISIYLIKDSAALNEWFTSLAPPGYESDFIRLRDEINTIWSAFFRGQLLLAVIVSLILTAEGLIIGLPFAVAMGVLGGILEFLPSVGHGIWLVLASLLALFGGSTWLPLPNWAFALVVLALHITFTQFDLNYLIPRIIGRSVRLPPVVVILGILSGAALAGVLGVVLAAPPSPRCASWAATFTPAWWTLSLFRMSPSPPPCRPPTRAGGANARAARPARRTMPAAAEIHLTAGPIHGTIHPGGTYGCKIIP